LHHGENFDPKPEELDPHYNKIYGKRLIHDKDELDQRINCTLDDLKSLIRIYKDFSMERDVIGDIAKCARKDNEGYLGKTPKNVNYVSEVMLFDSAINVYSDSHVVLSDLHVNKPISKRNKK
jgi:hypothetical protein